MLHRIRFSPPWAALVLAAILSLLASMLPAGQVQATPMREPGAPTSTTVELIAIEDQGMIESVPTFIAGGAPYFVLNGRPDTHSEDWNFIQFDLSDIPVDATINSAQLKLDVIGFGGPARDLEVGRVDGDWEEGVTSWSTMPPVTWGGPVQTITTTGDVAWPLKSLVEAWHNGSIVNNGVVVRTLDNGNNAGAQALTKDGVSAGDFPPRLVLTYSEPPFEGPRPDLGDAPDSSNHHGINNTAYPAAGILGQFPTVWDVPAGQPAGPRHNNQTGEGILGNFLSREAEADLGPDQDVPNNILRNSLTGAVGDVANNDRGDDGWRNRNIRFFDCQRQTLIIRVSKAQNATLKKMYLNVWFDGNRDGDWQDTAACPPADGGPAQASYEWIVQDYFVDMTAIPAGGFLDIQVNTERVLNATQGAPHWMRFMLSEELSVKPPLALADGRGPHPNSPLGAYKHGETEDVLQKPPVPGENGELVLEKRVDTSTSPVLFGDMVTYEILLRHEGGSQPVQAQIRDELPYPLHIHPRIMNGTPRYVVVESPTGGAGPLLATLDPQINPLPQPPTQVIKWQGTLAPNSEIKLTFDVHVLPLCGPNEQTKTIRNLAQARPGNGNPITDEVSFEAACPSYDGIVISQHGLITDTLDSLLDWHDLPLQAEITNHSVYTATLGLIHSQSTNVPIAAGAAADNSRILERVTLAPGATQLVDFTLRMENEFSDELKLPADYAVVSNLAFCILPGADYDTGNICPDRQHYPQLWGQAQPITFTVRPNDLGDAPDSTNHAGVAMTAYAGTAAHYPTVFDPALGQPQGPRHRHPRPFHLGERVSREVEADIGPDQDPQNNIEPVADVANLDQFDDGSRLSNLSDCQPATAEVLIAITPQAWNWFNAQNQPAYLNVWADSNRDGDWDDGFTCQSPGGQQADVVEHILIDQPIDVIALGPGLHALTFATNRVRWPAQLANQPSWLRFTLSEQVANKTFIYNNINYSDGRGYATPFQTGETEDHRFYPPGGGHDGPDLAVQLNGRIAPSGASVQFKIEIANQGSQPADGATLTFQKPPQLRDHEVVLLQAPGIPPTNISDTGETIKFLLPFIEQDNIIAILIGLAIPPEDANNKSYNATVAVNQTGDTDSSNDSATTTVNRLAAGPLLAAVVGADLAWGFRETTCRNEVNLAGMGANVDLLVDGQVVATLLEDEGIWYHLLQNLSDGRHVIQAVLSNGIISPRDPSSGLPTGKIVVDVNSDLPIDPLSLTLTDSQGRVIHPATLGWSAGSAVDGAFLRAGETYEVGINRCVSDPNLVLQLELENTPVSNFLRDDDGDGRYAGSFTFDPGVQAAAANAPVQLRLIVTTGDTEQSFSTALQPLAPGIVRDAQSGQPLANASVTALSVASLAQLSPQVTGADGGYNFSVPDGIYRLEVTLNGYQSYRSAEIAVTNGSLAQDITLTPVLNEAAAHTIYVTANGFEPAFLKAKPGDVVAWVNADLTEHTSTHSGGWDSGALAVGERYQIKLDAEGTYTYGDGNNPVNTGTIQVEAANLEEPPASTQVFLPLVNR